MAGAVSDPVNSRFKVYRRPGFCRRRLLCVLEREKGKWGTQITSSFLLSSLDEGSLWTTPYPTPTPAGLEITNGNQAELKFLSQRAGQLHHPGFKHIF